MTNFTLFFYPIRGIESWHIRVPHCPDATAKDPSGKAENTPLWAHPREPPGELSQNTF